VFLLWKTSNLSAAFAQLHHVDLKHHGCRDVGVSASAVSANVMLQTYNVNFSGICTTDVNFFRCVILWYRKDGLWQHVRQSWITFNQGKNCTNDVIAIIAYISGFQPGVATPGGSLVIFLGRKSFWQNYSYLLLYFIFLMELLFVVDKIIRSPGKNDSLLFHSKLF